MEVAALPVGVVEDFFLTLGLQSVALLLLCTPDEIKVKLLRRFSDKGIAATFSDSAVLESAAKRIGAVIDISCGGGQALLQELSDKKVFNMRTEYLLVERRERPVDLAELNFPVGSCVTLARSDGDWVDYYEVYRVVMWSDMRYLHLARQRTSGPFGRLPPRSGRTDFGGVTLRSAGSLLYKDQFRGLNIPVHTEADPYLHSGVEISHNIAEHYNFTFSMVLTLSYGYQENGTFSGLMGYFQRSEVDFSFTGLLMWHDRFEFVEFAGNMYQIRSPVIFRQPSLPTVTNIFTLPFSREVWLASLLLSGLTTLALLADLVTSVKVLKLSRSDEIPSGEVVMTVIGHISQQGPSLSMKTSSSEITLLLFSFFSFFISIAYSAKIVALLQSSTNTIKTLPQLIDSPLTVLIQDLYYNKFYLEGSTNKEVKDFYTKKVLPNGLSTWVKPDFGIHKVKSGLYAFKVDSNWAYTLIADTYRDREKCGLSEMSVFVMPMIAGSVARNSGLREHFSRMLAWQYESGLYQRTMSKLMAPTPRCNSKGGYATVSLHDFRPAIAAILYGTALSIALFVLELMANLRLQLIRAKALPHEEMKIKDRAKNLLCCTRKCFTYKC